MGSLGPQVSWQSKNKGSEKEFSVRQEGSGTSLQRFSVPKVGLQEGIDRGGNRLRRKE